jgi:hypothetical protein
MPGVHTRGLSRKDRDGGAGTPAALGGPARPRRDRGRPRSRRRSRMRDPGRGPTGRPRRCCRSSVVRAPVVPSSPLRGRDHERLVLDRAGSDQHVPVVDARLEPERRGHEQERRAVDSELAVELREAHVVADREPGEAEFGVGDDDLTAGRVEERLAARLAARRVRVEQVSSDTSRRARRRDRTTRSC